MEVLVSLLTNIATTASITEMGMSIIILSMLVILYKFLLDPMFRKVKSIPSEEKLKQLFQDEKDFEKINVEDFHRRLDIIVQKIEHIEHFGEENYRELKDLKRDIETIKQILNQFQGHMMYGRRASDFGNMELK